MAVTHRKFIRPQDIAQIAVKKASGIPSALSKEFIFDPETQRILPSSPVHDIAAVAENPEDRDRSRELAMNIALGTMSPVASLETRTASKMVPRTSRRPKPKNILTNNEAKKVAKLSDDFESRGNISIEDTDWVLKKAKEKLDIPKREIRKMSIPDIIAEMGGTFTPNQDFAFRQLRQTRRAASTP